MRVLCLILAVVFAIVWLGSCGTSFVLMVNLASKTTVWVFGLVSLVSVALAVVSVVLAGSAGARAERRKRDKETRGKGEDDWV